MKEDLINKLVATFKEETERYSNEIDGVVNYKFEEFFKKNNPSYGCHSVDACIMFKNYTLKLEYKVNISSLLPKSIIEMRFMFENGKLPVEFSIYDVLNIIDQDNFKCYTFSYVTKENQVKQILKDLVDTFKEYKERIDELSLNAEEIQNLEIEIENKSKLFLNEDIFKSRDVFYLIHMLDLYYIMDISRFAFDGYINYTAGNYLKAIKKYNKLKGKLTSYEKRLIQYIKVTQNQIQLPIEQELNTIVKAKKIKNVKIQLFPLYLSWLILTPIWCIIYDFVFYIADYFLCKNAIYVAGSFPFGIVLPAFITAIIHSYFTRNTMYKLLFKKKYEDIRRLCEIAKNNKLEKLMSNLFQFVIAASLIFSVLLANTNISFYEEYFKDNLNLLNIQGTSYSYEDVYCVYKADGMLSNFGKLVNNPTYVIVLKGGEQINLYFDVEFEVAKNNIIPIFEKRNIEIREIDLINNIEKDLESEI